MSRKKAKALKIHANRRAHERFGISINPRIITQMIQSNQGTFVKSQSNRVTVWDIVYKGETVRVVYDKKRGLPITVLDPEKHKI